MEIEKIISTVSEKVGKTDFSPQTIRKAVELFPVAEGQEPDDAYFEKVSGFITTMQGQYNHDFSVKFSEQKKNLLTEDTFKSMSAEQISDIKKLIDGIAGKPTVPPADDAKVTALEEEVRKLREQMEEGDKTRVQSELLSKLRQSMKVRKADDDYVLDATLRGVTLDVKKTLDELTEEYLVKYDSEYRLCRGSGAVPRMSASGGGENLSALDAKFKQKAVKEGWGQK
jgi:hypothetical protein